MNIGRYEINIFLKFILSVSKLFTLSLDVVYLYLPSIKRSFSLMVDACNATGLPETEIPTKAYVRK